MNMREIKFRVWSFEQKEWVEKQSSVIKFSCELNEVFETQRYEFQQFTGLLDKNNREIYEGDIIQTLYENGEPYFKAAIQYNLKCMGYSFHIPNKPALRCDCHFFDRELEKPWHGRSGNVDNQRFEIIGNIFESPELLK